MSKKNKSKNKPSIIRLGIHTIKNYVIKTMVKHIIYIFIIFITNNIFLVM